MKVMAVGRPLGTDFFMKLAVAVCVFGLLLLLALVAVAGHHTMYPSFSRPLVGSLFASLCLAGIAAVFYPKNCEGAFMFGQPHPAEKEESSLKKIQFSGHHPACSEFSKNRIKIKDETFCASCAGLLVGALAALVGTAFYFFVPFLSSAASLWLLFPGYVSLSVGLFQFRFGGFVKLGANAAFVVGSFLTLVAVDVKANLLIDLYGFGLIVFLLLTRISISEWNNKRICDRCSSCRLRS